MPARKPHYGASPRPVTLDDQRHIDIFPTTAQTLRKPLEDALLAYPAGLPRLHSFLTPPPSAWYRSRRTTIFFLTVIRSKGLVIPEPIHVGTYLVS